MKKIAKKAIRRLFRIITLHGGIYGEFGSGNIFKHGVIIDEESSIGYNNYFGNNVKVTATIIGNYCSIAPNVTLGPGEHRFDFVSTKISIMEKLGHKYSLIEKPLIVGNDVWIGANAVVLRGHKIGNGAVIAAGAVVTTDVPDFSIFGGVPAKMIKYRFSKKQIEEILYSKWYEKKSLSEAVEIVSKIQEKWDL